MTEPRGPLRHIPIVVASLILAGCGGDWKASTYPATGRVLINGEPPVGALVQLQPIGGTPNDARGSRPWGVVQDDGTYTLTTYDEVGPGAPAGEYAIVMTWPPDVSVPSTEDLLKGKFADPDSSPWKVTIGPRANVLPAVEIDGLDLDEKARSKRKQARRPPNPNDPALLKQGAARRP